MMESESQCVFSVISKQQLEVLLQFSCDVFLVGEHTTEFYNGLTKKFGRRKVHLVDTVEDLNSFKTNRSKIGVAVDVSVMKGACTSLCFSVDAFRKLVGTVNHTYTVNGKGMYNSFTLECCKVFMYDNARNPENVSLVIENNGLETFTPEDADFVLFSDSPKSEATLREWILFRQKIKPAAKMFQVQEFAVALATPDADLVSIKEKGNNGIFRNVTFYSINLPNPLAKSIVKEGGQLTESWTNEFSIMCGSVNEELILVLHHNQRKWTTVDDSAVTEALNNQDLNIILNSMQGPPPLPKFHSVCQRDHLYLYPDQALCETDKKEFFQSSADLGFKVAKCVEECHGIISPVILKDRGECEHPPRRNILCLREMKEKGPHESCSFTHFCFLPQGSFSVLKDMNIVGIKADDEIIFFVQRVLEGSGIKVTWKSDINKRNLVFLDVNYVKDKFEILSRLEKKGMSFYKTELIFQVLSSSNEVGLEDFAVNLSDFSNSALPTTMMQIKAEVVQSPFNDQNVAAVPASPDLFPTGTAGNVQSALETTSAKRMKLDWDDADELALISKTRCLFGSFMTHQLRFSNLQLDIGTLYTKELRNFPVSDSPITMSITFRADNLKTNTGVINDFSKCLTRCNQSPIVGGVFYDYTIDLVKNWGGNLFGKLYKVFTQLGFKNIYCRECHESENGMDLFILVDEEQVNLCCFRTLDNRFDSEVSSAEFCAAKFWIPERVIEVLVTQSRLHFALTCPHVIIHCGDDERTCYCKKPPMDMCGKLIQHTFHVPENAPKLAQKGAWAYFKRTGDYSGELSFERMGKHGLVKAANYEDLATQLVTLLRNRKWDDIKGDGKVSCLECTTCEGCMKVVKIKNAKLICYKCGKECLQGVFVL